MTLNLTPEEKAERRRKYAIEYSKAYYREQKAENSETYKKILDKAKERYENKKNGTVRQYKKRNILKTAQIENDEAQIENDEAQTVSSNEDN